MKIRDIYGGVLLEVDADNLQDVDFSDVDLSFADLSGEDLSCVDLRWTSLIGADLSGANLKFADLRGTNLKGANLREANLMYAALRDTNLSNVDLREANTDKRYIQISCIGSQKRQTTYCFDDDIVWCGCFKGSLNEFEERVKEIHKDNEQYLKEYIGFIQYIKILQL